MKIGVFTIRLLPLVVSLLTVMNVCAAEYETKPTREQIIAFLEDWRNNHPLTEEEKQDWKKREKIDLVKQFGTDFTGLDLSGINFLIGINFLNVERQIIAPGIDFSGSDMQGVYFCSAVLTGCNFANTNLENAEFQFCKLDNADFSHAKLRETNFISSDMRHVLFAGLDAGTCKFYHSDFYGAKLMNTDFTHAEFSMYPKFQKTDFTGANLSAVDLCGADFEEANLKDVHFKNTDLRWANFTSANLEGTDFTGANLYAALFIDVRGIDDSQRRSLERRSARWFYDFTQNFYALCRLMFIPVYLLTLIFAVIFSITGLVKKGKTLSFVIACCCNGFAVFSTFCTLLMMFSGGHPVKQMSGGNYDAWSTWLHFFPILLFGLMLCIVISFVLTLFVSFPLIRKPNNVRPWRLLLYQVLTLGHCFLAFCWLGMFMPDA